MYGVKSEVKFNVCYVAVDGPADAVVGATNKVVAFLLAERSLGESLMSQQQSSQLHFMPIRAMIVVWSRFALWSVWIFLNMEKPRSESALEIGIERSPAINRDKNSNLGCPYRVVIFLTSDQNKPALDLMTPSAALYFTTVCRRKLEVLKFLSKSIQRSSIIEPKLREPLSQTNHLCERKR